MQLNKKTKRTKIEKGIKWVSPYLQIYLFDYVRCAQTTSVVEQKNTYKRRPIKSPEVRRRYRSDIRKCGKSERKVGRIGRITMQNRTSNEHMRN